MLRERHRLQERLLLQTTTPHFLPRRKKYLSPSSIVPRKVSDSETYDKPPMEVSLIAVSGSYVKPQFLFCSFLCQLELLILKTDQKLDYGHEYCVIVECPYVSLILTVE